MSINAIFKSKIDFLLIVAALVVSATENYFFNNFLPSTKIKCINHSKKYKIKVQNR